MPSLLDTTSALPLADLPNIRLINTEEGLHRVYDLRKSAGLPLDEIAAAHELLARAMRQRGLVYNPLEMPELSKAYRSKRQARWAFSGGLSKGQAKEWADKTDFSKLPESVDEDDSDEKMRKAETSGVADPASPNENDGIHVRDGSKTPKPKRGKGGEKNRTQRSVADEDVDDDTDDENDGTLGYIKAGPHVFKPDDEDATKCAVCNRPKSDHYAKAVFADASLFHFDKAVGDLSTEERRKMAETGVAMPDGSMPIPDEAHLHAAVRLVGQHPDPQSAMNHIIARAHAMDMKHALPPAWRTTANDSQDPGASAPVGMGAEQMPGPGGDVGPGTASNVQPVGGTGGKPGAGAGAGAKKPPLAKRLISAMVKAVSSDSPDSLDAEIELADDFAYAVMKSTNELRYTMGPVYMPNIEDAHGEWASAEDLRKSLWDYVESTGDDRTIFLQHSPHPAGQWVEVMQWPSEVRATMIRNHDSGVRKAESTTFPAGTVYMGVRWEPWAYEEVKKGRITGFSMGGWAARREASPAA